MDAQTGSEVFCVDGKSFRRKLYRNQKPQVEVLPGWGGKCPYCESGTVRKSHLKSGGYLSIYCQDCDNKFVARKTAAIEMPSPTGNLTDEDIVAIADAIRSGQSLASLARQFGVSRQRIYQIKSEPPKPKRSNAVRHEVRVIRSTPIKSESSTHEDAELLLKIMEKISLGTATQPEISKAACLTGLDPDDLLALSQSKHEVKNNDV